MTEVEFRWRVQNAPRGSIFVVGDSRVGWRFAKKQFEAKLRSLNYPITSACNAALPGNADDAMIRYILSMHRRDPGTLVVNFSVAGFYHFKSSLPTSSAVALQDYVDDQIRSWISGYAITSFRRPADLLARLHHPNQVAWVSRQYFDDGFTNASLGRDDGVIVRSDDYELSYYVELLLRSRSDRPRSDAGEGFGAFTEKARLARIIEANGHLGPESQELHRQCNTFLSAAGVAPEPGVAVALYRVRNLIFHSFNRVSGIAGATVPLTEFMQQLVCDLALSYKSPTVQFP